MGKVFVTDEVNDNYTLDITNARKAKVENGAGLHQFLSSAATTVNTSGQVISETPCYIKSVILGTLPVTATQLRLYDCTDVSASNLSAFANGDNVLAHITMDSSAGLCALAAAYPRVLPFDVYCASGLTVAIGEGQQYGVLSGCAKNVTIVYQT